MSGYVIAQIKDIKDKEIYKDYVSKVTPIVEKFGGKFLVRGGQYETKEGIDFSRNVVVEFDSYETALVAYSSSEYKKALTLLEGGAERMYAVVEGYE